MTDANIQRLIQLAYLDKSKFRDASTIKHPIIDLIPTMDLDSYKLQAPLMTGKGITYGGGVNGVGGESAYNAGVVAARSNGLKTSRWDITDKEHNAFASVERRVVLQERNGGAKNYVKFAAGLAEKASDGLKDKLAWLLCNGKGDGFVGTIGAINGTTITFVKKEAAVALEEGDQLVIVAAADYAGATRSGGTGFLVTAGSGDPVNGTVVCTGTVTSEVTSTAVGDYVFLRAFRLTGAAAAPLALMGFGGWMPTTDPAASESFNGVDRSGKPRLYGMRVGGGGDSISSAVNKALAYNLSAGGVNNGKRIALMHPLKAAELRTAMENSIVTDRSNIKGTNDVIFNMVRMKEGFDIVEEPAQPRQHINILQLDTWFFVTANPGGKVVTAADPADGPVLVKRDQYSDYGINAYSYCDLLCTLPQANVLIDLDSAASID